MTLPERSSPRRKVNAVFLVAFVKLSEGKFEAQAMWSLNVVVDSLFEKAELAVKRRVAAMWHDMNRIGSRIVERSVKNGG